MLFKLDHRGKRLVPTVDELSPVVLQAMGMVSVQAECSLRYALMLLKERAQVTGLDLLDVADATVFSDIRFGVDA